MDGHRAAVKAALATNEALEKLIGRMGTNAHPRGAVMRVYGTARRALAQAENVGQVRDALMTLRSAMWKVGFDLVAAAAAIGRVQAQAEAEAYDLPVIGQNDGVGAMQSLEAWLAALDGQIAQATGMYVASRDVTLLVGDDGRSGIVTPGPVVREGARWLAVVAVASATLAVEASVRGGGGRQRVFVRQAVAALDERTTECCLRVHGQTVAMDEPFHLNGTPRFADTVMAPPFHWYCRSAVALVPVELADDALSREMRAAAADEAAARAASGGQRVVIHPASATSRR